MAEVWLHWERCSPKVLGICHVCGTKTPKETRWGKFLERFGLGGGFYVEIRESNGRFAFRTRSTRFVCCKGCGQVFLRRWKVEEAVRRAQEEQVHEEEEKADGRSRKRKY